MMQTINGDNMKNNKKIYESGRNIDKIMNKRFFIISILIVFIFFVISLKIFNLTIIKKPYYEESLASITADEIYGPSSPRGRIYDRNHKLLVDNKAVPIIYYRKPNKVTVEQEISLAKKIIEKIDIDHSKLSETNLKEFWIVDNEEAANKKITDDEWEKLKNRVLTLNDIYNLKKTRITNKDLSIYKEKDKKIAYLYYLMNKGYSYEDKIIKKEGITDQEYAYIAENVKDLEGFNVKYDWQRVYLYDDVFRSILGNISTISEEEKDYYLSRGYNLNDIVGTSYLEKQYEHLLKGKKEKYKLDSNNNLMLVESGQRGNDIVLTIDIELQKEVESILKKELIATKKEANTKYFNHSFVVIQEPNTGEVLAMSGKQVVYKNGKYEIYDYTPGIMTAPMTPGSVVKGASTLVGFNEQAIKIGEYQTDDCIKLYSIPRKCSWSKLGKINDIDALAYSSNVYQFKTAMKVAKFKYSPNKKFEVGDGVFNTYRKTFNELGLGVKTGIDLPVESVGNVGSSGAADLLLNFAIGQYDTYTPIQLSQYITTIASNGNRLQPHLLKEVYKSSNNDELNELLYKVEPNVLNKVNVDEKYLKRVQKGLKAVMDYGLGKNFMGDSPSPAGKTGTSESFLDTDNNGKVDTETLSNAFVGYAPSDKPVMTITTTFPNLVNPNGSSSSRSYANIRITKMISNKFFELYNKK